MKTTRNTLLLGLLLLMLTPLAASAQLSVSAGISVGPSGRASVDLGFFYDNLASYGNWIQRPSYGWVWTPRTVDTGWRPYQDGHWVWTDQGWTWISDEPYGWATYHYGRWYEDPELGWVWVPGDEWAPAWVSWQEGDDYIGWAPLPPSYQIGASYDNGGYGYGLGPESYVFVPERNFLSLQISTYVVPRERVGGFFRNTRNYTNYRVSGNAVFNQGIPVDRIQRAVGRSVPRYQLSDLRASDARQRASRVSGNQVQIFRPQVQRNVQVTPPASRPAARNSVISATQFQQAHPNRATRVRPANQGNQGTVQAPGRQPQAFPNPGQQNQGNRQSSSTRGKTWQQIQAERQGNPQANPPSPDRANRQRQNNDNQPPPQVQPQVRTERQQRPNAPQQIRVPERQRPPQTQTQQQPPPPNERQRQPRVDPRQQQQAPPPQAQPNRGQAPQDNNKAHQQQRDKNKNKDKNKDRNQDQDDHRPPRR